MYGGWSKFLVFKRFSWDELLLTEKKITKIRENITQHLKYLVEQWYNGHLVKQKDMRFILLLPAREESDIIFTCNLKLNKGC